MQVARLFLLHNPNIRDLGAVSLVSELVCWGSSQSEDHDNG